MKISEALQIIKPKYKYLKLIPNNSIRNNNTNKMARAISYTYKNVFQRIQADNKKIIKLFGKEYLLATKYNFILFEKVSYFIYIEKQKVEFYFIIPETYETLFKEKLNDVWESVTIETVKELPKFYNPTKYTLQYSKEDALSLQTDLRDNDLLRSNLNIINSLDENERVGIFYNFIPVMQYAWKNEYKATINKIKNYEPVDKDKSKLSYFLKYGLTLTTGLINAVLDSFVDKKAENKENLLEGLLRRLNNGTQLLSNSTIKKENSTIIKSQILVLSESANKIKQHNNASVLSHSFEAIAADNKLVPKVYNKAFNYDDYLIKAPINKISDLEAQNFISLTGRELLEEYGFINKVETKETEVPEELRQGVLCIGLNTYKGVKQPAYLSTDKEYKYLSLIIIGPNRAGKSTLLGNLGKDAINAGEVVINFDYIKNCELSEEMAALFNKDQVLNIECSDFNKLQGLGYNEIKQSDDIFTQYANTKLQTMQLTILVNSINSSEQSLSTRMERYLQSAANIVFMNNGSIKDVFDVLQNYKIRNIFINKIPKEQQENLAEQMEALKELNEVDKDGIIIGTKYSRIDGIIDRLNKLKANAYMEQMLKKDCTNNIDLVQEMQKNQLINIKMPENMFSTDNEKDIYAIYWLSKIWLALQIRGNAIKDRNKMLKVNLFIDELYQVNNTEKFLTEKLSRLPKFNIKPVISCHYLNQIKFIREELRSANASYMLIAGCDKKNFKELESELYPFKEEDLLNLKRFNSLNLIKVNNGYSKFITQMPGPI